MKNKKLWAAVASGLLAMSVSGAAFGQEQDRGGDRGGRGNFDPAQFRERMNQMMKERLGASDDEWKILQPLIEKVQTAQRNASTRGGGFSFFGGGGPGGPGGPGGGPGGPGGGRGGDGDRSGGDRGGDREPETPLAKAASELRQATESKDTDPSVVKAKLTAFREARTKARDELTASQKQLTEVLTPRQEAILVSMGTLD